MLLVPSAAYANDYDYNDGYFDVCKDAGNNAKYTDNNTGTGGYGESYTTIKTCGEIIAYGIYLNIYNGATSAATISFGFGGKSIRVEASKNYSGYIVFDKPYAISNSFKINYYTSGTTNFYIREIELFTVGKIQYEKVNNLAIKAKETTADVTFTVPNNNADYVKTLVYLDGNLVGESTGSTILRNLKPNTTYTLKLANEYSDGFKVDTVKEFTTLADTTPPAEVINLNAAITNKKDIKLSYAVRNDADFSYVQIYRDDKLLVDNYKETSYTDTATEYDTSYTYKIVAVDTTGNKSAGVSKTIKTSAQTADNVSNLYAAIDGKKDVKLSYKLAGDTSYVRIYRDDKLLVDNYKETSYTDKTTDYSTSYVYKVVAVNSAGIVATGTSKTIKTPQSPPKDASSLSYTATSNSVSLKWRNTTLDDFTAVTIYRKNNTVAANVRALFSAGDGYTKLHSGKVETYTDNSVESDTSYKYKITTTIAGVESNGVTVDVKTKPLTLDDTTLEQQPNGDYVVTWGAPTTGKMQINVGGTKYAVVPAANKTFTIPAADVKFNALGFADVQLVPLNDAEQPVGPGTKPGGGGLGSIIGGGGGEGIFDAPDLVKAAASLLALVGGFILLGLAFRVVPMLVKTIRNALISGGAKR